MCDFIETDESKLIINKFLTQIYDISMDLLKRYGFDKEWNVYYVENSDAPLVECDYKDKHLRLSLEKMIYDGDNVDSRIHDYLLEQIKK
ncbi:MAG: hypothetical protein FVQ82_02915 [Planctomycetes bacterium]|nr:hypothetical protein [Planctomycetota bacterium]